MNPSQLLALASPTECWIIGCVLGAVVGAVLGAALGGVIGSTRDRADYRKSLQPVDPVSQSAALFAILLAIPGSLLGGWLRNHLEEPHRIEEQRKEETQKRTSEVLSVFGRTDWRRAGLEILAREALATCAATFSKTNAKRVVEVWIEDDHVMEVSLRNPATIPLDAVPRNTADVDVAVVVTVSRRKIGVFENGGSAFDFEARVDVVDLRTRERWVGSPFVVQSSDKGTGWIGKSSIDGLGYRSLQGGVSKRLLELDR
ncbi:MAG: hypothetical protein HY720_32520 [Planctomycetes bacterium]|nr:hypothetical protein [Planctomycetota bacterium]